MEEMRNGLDTIKSNIARVEGKLTNVSSDVNQHIDQTTSQLATMQQMLNEAIATCAQNAESTCRPGAYCTRNCPMDKPKLNLTAELEKINLKLELLDIDHDKIETNLTLISSELEKINNNTTELEAIHNVTPTVELLLNLINATFHKHLEVIENQIEQHSMQTSAELTQIQITLNHSHEKLLEMLQSHNQSINVEFRELDSQLEEHVNQTTHQLAELQRPSNEQLMETLVSINTSITRDLSSIEGNLEGLDSSVMTLVSELESHRL